MMIRESASHATSAATSRPETTIVIATRDCLGDIRNCLASIVRSTPSPYRIVVVDDGSTDGTSEFLQAWAESNPNSEVAVCNRGRSFTAVRNLGLSLARGEYVVLLDSSAVVTDGWLPRLAAVCEREPNVGVVGPLTNQHAGPQALPGCDYTDVAGLEALAAEVAVENAGQTDPAVRVHGFCMLLRASVLMRIGALDERMFAGFEFFDWCLRAAHVGYEVRIARDVLVHQHVKQLPEAEGQQGLERDFRILKAKWGISRDRQLGGPIEIPRRPPKTAMSLLRMPDLAHTHRYDPHARRWNERPRASTVN